MYWLCWMVHFVLAYVYTNCSLGSHPHACFNLAGTGNYSGEDMAAWTSTWASNASTYPGYQAGLYSPRWGPCRQAFTALFGCARQVKAGVDMATQAAVTSLIAVLDTALEEQGRKVI